MSHRVTPPVKLFALALAAIVAAGCQNMSAREEGTAKGAAVGAVAGAVIGGIIGSNVEADANKGEGLEITVLLDSGRYIAVVQAGGEGFRVGDRVRVLSGQGTTRVSH